MFTPCRAIFLSERSEHLKICGTRPLNIFQRQDAEVKRSPRLSSTGKDAVYSVVVEHCCFHYPCIRAFPDCLPYSLYIIFSKKEDLSGDTDKFRGCPAYRIDRYSSGFLIRLFTYRSETAVEGINLSVKLCSVHSLPVQFFLPF